MAFPQAMDCVRQGMAVTRQAWDNTHVTVELKNGLLTIHLADGTDRGWLVSEADMFARDWQTVTHG